MSSRTDNNEWVKTNNLCLALVKNNGNEIMDNIYPESNMFYRIAHKIEGEYGIFYLDALSSVRLNDEENNLAVEDEEDVKFTDMYISKSELSKCQDLITNLYNPMIETNLIRKRKK